MPKNLPGVLFDLDGTLTNPFEGITNCIRYAMERMGEKPPLAADLHWCIGPPLQHSFARLLDTNDRGRITDAVAFYRERYGDVGKFENSLITAIPAALEKIVTPDRHACVATSKLETYSVHIVEHFGLTRFFHTVHGSAHDGTNADKPDLIAHIMAVEPINPARTVMIGDRLHDIVGARANGITSIGVLWGFGDREELADAGADEIVERPSDLAAAVDRLLEHEVL